MNQWNIRITKYADALLQGINSELVNHWPEKITALQKGWIGKSTGHTIKFTISKNDESSSLLDCDVFTTRLDTICGVTFLALSADHPLIKDFGLSAKEQTNLTALKDKMNKAKFDSDLDLEKECVMLTSVKAINPLTKLAIPVLIGNYV